jgi:hypothetical protein
MGGGGGREGSVGEGKGGGTVASAMAPLASTREEEGQQRLGQR